jgi:hypothetical protein
VSDLKDWQQSNASHDRSWPSLDYLIRGAAISGFPLSAAKAGADESCGSSCCNLRHLTTLLDELQTLGVAFVSLADGIDATTPAGKLQMS